MKRWTAVRIVLACSVLLTAAFLACQDQSLDRTPAPDPRIGMSDDDDASSPSSDASRPRGDGGCPAPRVLAPADLGAGFLPPQKVTLVRSVDGDTAHFRFPGSGEQTCRFLWVDTEESSGADMTAFGAEAKNTVAQYLRAANEIIVAVQESPTNPGQPAKDTYDRWLSLVFVDGDLFQTRLVREGWTPYYSQFGCAPEPVHSTLIHAEAEANGSDHGIWQADHPLDYEESVARWMGRQPWCRPNPFRGAYCF